MYLTAYYQNDKEQILCNKFYIANYFNSELYDEFNSNKAIAIAMSSLHMNVVACLGSEECHNTPGLLQHN